MDSFDFDNVKVEKANAMLRYHRLRKIANLFRFVEICVALIMLSWFSTRLPIAIRISGEYFRDLCVVLVSPLFVFFVGNAIIITLFAKSGQFSGEKPLGNNAGTDLYHEFVKNSESGDKIRTDSPPLAPEKIVYQDKQMICEENTITPSYRDTVTTVTDTAPDTKVYQRSQSENLKQKPCRKLRRSETEKCRKMLSSGDKPVDSTYTDDGMTSEEFQRTVEAFIKKQQMFQREESMAIVLKD
ncbi:hypothetical protein HHK36_003099 [Tetracentron sinense]|uniref:DUF4408 domain-containing protein n=1 Tax=Tetracentron sinense TaxID=13715 RepID=A0A835DNK9_TETSI|nr:hypothetical protein HHK36_003099 [Tetracentron sinense]